MAAVGGMLHASSCSSFFAPAVVSSTTSSTALQPVPSWSGRVMAGDIGPGKKWEHYSLNKNGKPIRQQMHVCKGDTVQIITGSDRGTVGEITNVITKTGQVVVAGVNIKTRHNKPKRQGEKGSITKNESPIHHSNVMLYSTTAKVRSRTGYKVGADGRKVRYLKKTGEEMPTKASMSSSQ